MTSNQQIFLITAVIVVVVTIVAIFANDAFTTFVTEAQNGFLEYFSWFVLILPLFFIGVLVWIYFSRHGKKKLGGEKSKPTYSIFAWCSMLITADIGIWLIFFSIAEPVWHRSLLYDVTGETVVIDEQGGIKISGDLTAQELYNKSKGYTIWDWGIQAWAIYSIAGLTIGYFAYRKKHKAKFLPGDVIKVG